MDTDVELATLTSLLDLDESEVVESSWDRRGKLRRLTLVPKAIVGLCPHCHGITEQRHVCHDRIVADLPLGGQRVELVVRLWQFHCRACDKFFTPRFAALAEGAHATERLLERLAAGKESGLLSAVEEVTCDMWDACVEAPKEVFGPTIRITIDRFHVMKNFQDRFNDARREIQRGLDKEQAKELKGSRWLWVTNPKNLTVEQRAQLEVLKRKFPELGRLAEHRQALRQIFEDKRLTTPAIAMERLREWCGRGVEMGLKALKQFNKTLENWMDKIVNYFVSRSSNGRTEGFNRGLRAVLWRACGMSNFYHFRLRVLHLFG